jgi:hypothetical protein
MAENADESPNETPVPTLDNVAFILLTMLTVGTLAICLSKSKLVVWCAANEILIVIPLLRSTYPKYTVVENPSPSKMA